MHQSVDSSIYNSKSPGVKRLMKEAAELRYPTSMYHAQPLDDNLFEWHFSVRGPADTDFEGGIYHGRIVLPYDYPMKPPSIILMTPNGRFQLNQKICLSISGHHPESWQPSWSIRTALLALIGFMPTHGAGALGSLDYPTEERKKLALESKNWICKECGACMQDVLPGIDLRECTAKSGENLNLGNEFKVTRSSENDISKSLGNENERMVESESSTNSLLVSRVLKPHSDLSVIHSSESESPNLVDQPVDELSDSVFTQPYATRSTFTFKEWFSILILVLAFVCLFLRRIYLIRSYHE